jgi:hypothetical protein
MIINGEAITSAPFFIGGMYKSGTSLLRAMLGKHSMIAAGLETYWFDLKWSADPLAGKNGERLYKIRDLFGIDNKVFLSIVLSSYSKEDFLTKFMGHWAHTLNKVRWLEKTPGNILFLDVIFQNWPNAKVIHIIRDPRDVYASLVEAKKWDTPEQFVEKWSLVFLASKQFKSCSDLLTAENYVEVRYEDLIANPELTVRKLLDFLGLPYEPHIKDFDGEKSDFSDVKRVTGKESTTLQRLKQPLTATRVGLWPRVLSDKQVFDFEREIEAHGLLDLYRRTLV